MTSTRLVLYGRTSLDKSEGRSVNDQLAELRRWADAAGHVIVAEHRDDGRSASRYARKDRPGWQQVQDLILDGEADMLATWEVSRASRDRAVWAALMAALIERRALFAVGGKVHDPSDPDDGFMLDLQAAQATRESAMTSKRTGRGARSRAAAGRPHGRINFGYRNEYDPLTGKVLRRVLDAEQAAVVREIADRLLRGESAFTIAVGLNLRQVPGPAGSKWYGSNMLRMIKSPTLAGLRQYRGEVLEGVTGTWPPILSVDEHRRVVAILNDPARRSSRTGAHIKHLLPGVAACGICGGAVRALTRKRATDKVVTYNCRDNYCFSRIAADVDNLVEQVVVGYLSRPDVAAVLSVDDTAAGSASDEVARLHAKLDEARRLVAADHLSLASLVDIEARTLPLIARAEQAARPRHVPSVVFDVAGAEAAVRWQGTPVAARREIVRALMHVRIHRAGHRDGTIPFDPTSIKIEWKHAG